MSNVCKTCGFGYPINQTTGRCLSCQAQHEVVLKREAIASCLRTLLRQDVHPSADVTMAKLMQLLVPDADPMDNSHDR